MRRRVQRIAALMALVTVLVLALGGSALAQVEDQTAELFQYHRGQDVFLMLMLVAFLMLFIKRFEWGVCLATLLVLAVSWPLYLLSHVWIFDGSIDIEAVILGAFASITLVIAIGVFLGHIGTPQYLVAGVLFVPFYVLNEWFMFEFLDGVMDAGGSILVHIFAAFFGWGVILALRNRAVLNQPMKTTVHSVSFVWLAAMLLLVLWPSFVSALVPPEEVIPSMVNAFMALLASTLTAYLTLLWLRKTIDPLVYTYAILAGGVAIGATVNLVEPGTAWVIGALAGVLSALSFLFVNDWLQAKTGVLDTMGVNNLHGIPGIFGGLSALVVAGAPIDQVWAVIGAIVIALVGGLVTGLVLRAFGRPKLMLDDAESFPMEEPRAFGTESPGLG